MPEPTPLTEERYLAARLGRLLGVFDSDQRLTRSGLRLLVRDLRAERDRLRPIIEAAKVLAARDSLECDGTYRNDCERWQDDVAQFCGPCRARWSVKHAVDALREGDGR